ncbi:MAG TPA: ribonuclease III [Thermopetrobacter sp.]|nr:ribonuclease III [Thermopetrobacter sp.]
MGEVVKRDKAPPDARELAREFAARTGYEFRDPALLEQALTHSADGRPAGLSRGYERLEFLGDRVLGLVVAEELFRRYPDSDEGRLARQFNHLVRKEACAEIARGLGLGRLMRTGETTLRHQAEASQNVLGDLCESVIAAIYLDSGLEAARKFIISLWEPLFARYRDAPRDPKSALQEWAAARSLPPPAYREVSRSGPDHDPRFVMEVSIEGLGTATGEGGSKRRAEQAAAAALMQRFDEESEGE